MTGLLALVCAAAAAAPGDPWRLRTPTATEGLFSSFGKVTRCKLYKDERGELKGDALVTFAKPTSATNALKVELPNHTVAILVEHGKSTLLSFQMNGFAITQQHTLRYDCFACCFQRDSSSFLSSAALRCSVTPADFSKKQREEEAKLPPECVADKCVSFQ